MDNKTKVQLADVQKTLFMPVWARAVETQKNKPLLTDKTAVEIANAVPGSEWLFDVTSPKGIEIANQVIQKSGLNSNSFFKWGLKDTSIISSWDKRIELLNTYYTFKIKGLGLSFRNWLKGYISDSLNIQYMVHLKICIS
jgi:hypothetical protein